MLYKIARICEADSAAASAYLRKQIADEPKRIGAADSEGLSKKQRSHQK